jgi:hypothetical protein
MIIQTIRNKCVKEDKVSDSDWVKAHREFKILGKTMFHLDDPTFANEVKALNDIDMLMLVD